MELPYVHLESDETMMKYHVRVNSGDGLRMVGTFKSMRQARSVVEVTEREWIENGFGMAEYTLQPKIKKTDLKYGRLVYTSWTSRFFTPIASIVEIP